MSEIQQSRYDQLLRRVADLKGPGSKVNDALTELFPVIDLERVPGELLFLSGIRLGMMGTELNAEVGSIAKIQIFNPVGSGKLVTVTTLAQSTSGGSTAFELFLTTVPLTTNVGNNAVRDTRAPPGSSTTAQLRTQLDAGGIATFWIWRSLGSTPQVLTDPNGVCVLAPGTGLTTAPVTTNQHYMCSFLFRERVAEPSELNF